MKPITQRRYLFITLLLFCGLSTIAQSTTPAANKKEPVMKTYLIERDIPGAGQLTPPDLKGISQKSCSVLSEMGPKIKWLHSYVTGNKIYCVYQAENEELLREHGKKGGFPVTNITEIGTTISPATAKE
ncbi:DUF4242 domain-containing protein [Lacibacter sp. H407]|uniref:DUF4242 domain-containing protein n=1 Tax=Lacibacter sp. H407 TaxID=3133423 RepID=UPI0030C27345